MEQQPEADHTRLVLLEGQVKELKNDVKALTSSVQDLVEAWTAAKGFIAFIQLSAKVVAACGVVWLAVKGFFGFSSSLK